MLKMYKQFIYYSLFFYIVSLRYVTGSEKFSSPSLCLGECIQAHAPQGEDYIWLFQRYGRVVKVEYEEPVNSQFLTPEGYPKYAPNGTLLGNWTSYSLQTWKIHCEVVNHVPGFNSLKVAHIQSFIDPSQRFARLRFTFQLPNGRYYEREPDANFYELEQRYFQDNSICSVSTTSQNKRILPRVG